MEITDLTAVQLAEKVRNKELSALEVTEKYIENIRSREQSICAFMEVYEDGALRQAKSIDDKISKGLPVGKLAGVPVALKDNICVRNNRASCSSKMLENYTAPYDSTVTAKLKAADAVLVGRTNMDEFAMGSSTENSAFKATKNPWNPKCIPGGSSGGSAASVGANMVPLALGSDTGGSIRQPASFCGVAGMKPTYGRVSRYGLIAFASSLDQIGPFSRNVEDCALLLGVISGYDPGDSTSVDLPVPDYLASVKKDIKGIRVGLPKEYFIKGLDPEVEDGVRKAVKTLELRGAVIKEISLPHTEYAVAVYYIIATAEASSNLARYDGVRYGLRKPGETDSLIETYKATRGEGFGQEVKRRIILGTYTLSAGYYEAYYGKAQKVRTLIRRDFDRAFEEVDVVITPTAPTVAFKAGEKTGDPLSMYLSDIFTIPCNLAGIPGISVCCGFSKNKLPIGLQVMGRPFEEETVLRTAYNCQ